jgi:hypothetical protein
LIEIEAKTFKERYEAGERDFSLIKMPRINLSEIDRRASITA